MHAQIVLFDGFDLLDVIAPYEVLYAGGAASDGAVDVELVSAEGRREVVGGTGGVTLWATAALDPERAGLVVVPGAAGRVGTPGETPDEDAGARTPDEFLSVLLGRAVQTGLPSLLKAAMDRPGLTVATVCGGSLLLGLAGLLKGRRATTHHLALETLAETGAQVVPARVVDDGDLVTGGGVTSGLDLGLYLLEREVGPKIAHAVEELFAYERRGVVWRDRGPAPSAP
ncbi:DJ-1/PfpI family protein [Streptomyces platensis]|uniref:DJ-1/PfpI family protein n=1 Tax=Streptomyces platensis TaxID=58346 RepID=A0AAE6NQB3_STRPT|nr:DJ-1/PfpI family protein [Streptomyces platensis]OSY47839.1 Isonitrile hydratase [Streptomyces platensis]QEV55716.1 DJ-1/PfpI family protein [Streptomyces platensis]